MNSTKTEKQAWAGYALNQSFGMVPRIVLAWLMLLFFASQISAQSQQTIVYTTKENLPSNGVYRTAIDNRGFLWVATENGLARFDGKNFRVYTTRDGLTDNEVIDISVDRTGTIWVIPFRGRVCFYNTFSDRFESEEQHAFLKFPNAGRPYKPFPLAGGAVIFSSSGRLSYLVKDGKSKLFDYSAIKSKPTNAIGFFELNNGDIIAFHPNFVYRVRNGRYEYPAIMSTPTQSELALQKDNRIYIANSNQLYTYQVSTDGKVILLATKIFPFKISKMNEGNKDILLISESGSVYIIDEKDLNVKGEVYTSYVPRFIAQDYGGNYWISTLSNGLIKLQQSRIFTFDAAVLKQNITAIYKGNYLFFGNNFGGVYAFDGLYNVKTIHEPTISKADGIVRSIVPVDENFFASAQSGSVQFDKNGRLLKLFNNPYENRASKNAATYSDTTMLMGNHAYTYLLDKRTFKPIDSVMKRVVSVGSTASGDILIGSNDGLYSWGADKRLDTLGLISKALTYRVNDILTTSDKLTWIALATDSLLVMLNKQIIGKIGLGRQIPGNICRTLFSRKEGEIWLGTNKGLSRINYQYVADRFNYTTSYFGTSDGLAGEEVNDLFVSDSLVYVATSNGISYFDSKLQLPVTDIATFITQFSVNDISMGLQDIYDLDYDQNNITIKFSGVDLSGFIPLFEYNINGGTWQQVDQIDLRNLPADKYNILVRAVKRDGIASSKVARIVININAPFWKKPLFWALIALIVFGSILFAQARLNERKRKIDIQKIETEKRITELEMQALKAQINPHFVFNCLNSIKGFIYEKDLRQADKYLDKFSDLMRSTIDNSDASLISLDKEVEYLENYLQLESLRFEGKFSYKIEVDKNVDKAKTMVPAMLLQPYVENAIRHGMRFLENRSGEIKITATIDGNSVKCMVDDNGIGRQQAALLKSKAHVEYQSKGMSISNRRAELYGISQEIIDKKDAQTNSLGTTIVLYIPKNLSA